MPPLRRPTPLEDRAMKILVDFFFHYFLDCDIDSDELRQAILFIRHKISPRMPPKLSAEFHNRLLKELESFDMWVEEDLLKIGGKIVMDGTIIGLDCPCAILTSLQSENVNRVRGISRLHLKDRLPYSLDTLHLENLTEFKYQWRCTDSDLVIIGKHCPKLEHLDVEESESVSDVGLLALSSCPDIQFLSVACCPHITASGLNHFLSVHKSICHLLAWPDSGSAGFDFRQDPNWEENLSVHESIESFTIGEGFSDRHLLCVVTRFPNLKSIKICQNLNVDLNMIKSLSKLSKIDLDASNGSNWANFESLLELFDPQIEHLVMQWENLRIMQRGLNSIFRLCKKLETLSFNCESESLEAKLVIPPFEKLKRLEAVCFSSILRLELGKMPELEYLQAYGFDVSVSEVESIVLDHEKFPKLKQIMMDQFWHACSADLDRLKGISRTNNLDLEIR